MKKILKVITWTVGIVSMLVLFAKPTAELFPVQLLAGAIIFGIFRFISRSKEAYEA